MKKAFTLIELLIVVAIIAILAAIAVPNFLEAQTRAKTARAKSDMRTFATGLESYRVDAQKYCPDGIDPWTHLGSTSVAYGPAHMSNFLSTPIAYLTNVRLPDPFKASAAGDLEKEYRYVNFELSYKLSATAARATAWTTSYVPIVGECAWELMSNGPDRVASTGTGPAFYVPQVYDPTNGTVSLGDIVRTQVASEAKWGF